ncbi:MAG: transposase [Deltaproteobacteria bacterium]|nr:transposase [Deltaproteobacteria bacterium]MBW2669071.1 transposase [Deltaproteobacteria bacterium]
MTIKPVSFSKINMGRAWRIEYEGALYHLMSRGNNGQDIYLNDTDRNLFLETISEMSKRFKVDIFAYVLMSSHYHLLVRTNRANLKKAMQWFGTAYTRRFNNRNSKSGHLFQGRYKSILVQNDAYVMRLSCYVHRNPLRAGIVRRLIDYKWSSYPIYAYAKKGPDWLSTEVIWSYFQGSNKHKQYREKVQKYAKEEKRLLEDVHHGMILGAKKFVHSIREQFLPDIPHNDLPQQKYLAKDIDIDGVLKKSAKVVQIDLDKCVQAKRLHGIDKQKRDLIVYLLWNKGLMTNEHLGRLFNISPSAISHSVKIFKEKMVNDKEVKNQFEKVNSQFKL